MTKNTIALMKGMVCPTNDGMDNRIAVSTVQAKLMQYGYMLDEDAFAACGKADLSWVTEFNNETLNFLREKTGGKHNFVALYKNFPQEVMAMSDFELFFNAICHYWSNGTWVPTGAEFEREIKFEKVKFTMLKVGTEADFDNIFTSQVSINQSLMPQDVDVITWFVNSGRTLVMPEVISFKENLCKLAGMGIKGLPIKTTTDVLRIAVYMSGGDIMLPSVPSATYNKLGRRGRCEKVVNPLREKFMFKKFSRVERRLIMDLLEASNCDFREMALKSQRWIRLAHGLHAGEYKTSHPKAFNAIDKVRNEKIVTWYGKLEGALDKSLEQGIAVLSERPGEFARRLDALVRKNQNNAKNLELIMSSFRAVMSKASNKVLFEQYGHFENRRNPNDNRFITIKGKRRPVQLPKLPALAPKVVETIHSNIFATLSDKYSALPSLGNCWIDPELKKIPLPTNMRSIDFTLRPTVRGTRLPFDNPSAKVVRPFIHWMDPHGSIDLDLSAAFVPAAKGQKSRIEVLSYSNLRVGNSVHSGDVRHRQGPCAEYIDIDIKDALAAGFKYVVVTVHNFNGGSLKSVESTFGIMEREHPDSNNHWLPDTLKNAMECKSDKSDTLLSIIDLETREHIFLDVDGTNSRTAWGNIDDVNNIIDMYAKPPAVSVYDLCLLHVNGRGREVTLDSNVETYFKYEDFCHDYVKTGELMGI